jgi:flagellin-like hook-associated protein FlgL
MRSNLLSLQETADSMATAQYRMSTGKKVNSALDNAVNYFQAQTLTNRANDLLSYKDELGQAIQTIKAASNGISGITTLVNSAKALAANAKSQLGTAATSQTLTISTLTGITGGNTINIGASTFTAVTSAGSASSTTFYVGGTTDQAASSLASAINLTTETHPITASVSGSVITLTPTTAGSTIFNGTGNTADIVATGLSNNFSQGSIASGADLSNSMTSYATLVSQLNTMQSDAGYGGVNLLSSSDSLTVHFGNSHTLAISGFDSTASGLAIDTVATSWTSVSNIQTSIDKLDTALSTLRTNSQKLSTNLSVVNARNTWISDISTTLQGGADKLVNADANEEGANILMLQTRQSLGTTALSLSSQQSQSVLRLFG